MSRDAILARIRRHRPAEAALPDIHAPAFITYQDRYAQFATLIAGLGGHALTLAPGQTVREAVDTHWPAQGRVVDTTQAIHDEAASPHDWADVDIAIVPGQLAVAENAAVWVSQDALAYRSLYFLAQRLVMVVPRDALVDTMRDAYARVGFAEHGFGSFISGSSRTADIEQSLVMGAHGAMAALVVFE
ncbi:LutC/YkgG family protein [Crenobacter caeni]|nr:LUD domain-containing protein [Crenobacter caeni]